MTQAQRDAIAAPANGLIVFNTTTNALDTYGGRGWENTLSLIGYGTTGQVLSSTGTGTAWINSSTSNSLFDTDGNTSIQLEETTNEDFIRFDTAGQERFVIDSAGRICVNTSNPIDTFNLTGDMFLTHNSIQSDDHAFEIDVNASGFGDVKALDIVYQTGALGAGSDEGVILVNIDESASTGGSSSRFGSLGYRGYGSAL